MSTLNLQPDDVKLIVNFFFSDEELMDRVIAGYEDLHGPVETRTEVLPFMHTTYYHEEMGPDLKKMLICFKDLVPRGSLVDLKHEAIQLERQWADEIGTLDHRPVNIDPGLLFPEKLILSTRKNFPQRIYLDRGVYADLTLLYRGGRFEALPWTYSDYLDGKILRFLESSRNRLIEQLLEQRQS